MPSQNWIDLNQNHWSVFGNKIIGLGRGIGSYGISTFIHTSQPPTLNGLIEVNLAFEQVNETIGGGLICRANTDWTFVGLYIFHNPNKQNTLLALGICNKGTFTPVFASNEPVEFTPRDNQLRLKYFSSSIIGELRNSKGKIAITGNIPNVAFPGYSGLMKLYRSKISATEFKVNNMNDPFTNLQKPIYKYDVFISHSSADKAMVEKVSSDFRNAGISYWIDHEQIGVGESISQKIEEGIRNSKHVLVCLSKNLGASNWCRAEYSAILHRFFSGTTNKRVLPLYLDTVADDDIPVLLYDLRRVKYSKKDEFSELIDYLRKN